MSRGGAILALCALLAGMAPRLAAAAEGSKIRSPEDGWVDLSEFLDETYGFVPLLIPITEPAVGYGAAGAMVFLDKPPGGEGLGRANITAVGGLATANGTWGAVAGDVRHFLDNRVQTFVGAVYTSVNLDFHGIAQDGALNDDPLRYTLEPVGGVARAKYRFGDSHIWAGMSYVLASTEFSFDEDTAPGLPDLSGDSHVSGLVPSFTYDSRDNMFTPLRGTYLEGSAGLFGPYLGGDDAFQRLNVTFIQYVPLPRMVTLGVRTGLTCAFGDVPFYLFPYVTLRGAPVMRYQGEDTGEMEVEVRWQFWKRLSVVGFAGYGAAWIDAQRLDHLTSVVTGGTGFRYELAREYGLHAGLDVAFGPDETAIYLQFGSAWARP